MQSSSDDELEFNCEVCMAKELMGKVNGRICFINQVDYDEFFPEFQRVKLENEDDFLVAVDEVLDTFKIDRVEVALKRFGLWKSRIHGVCIKSFPKSLTTLHLLSLLNICLGGESGSELTNLPFEGGILDQSNLFLQAYSVYIDEHSRHMRETRLKNKNETHR